MDLNKISKLSLKNKITASAAAIVLFLSAIFYLVIMPAVSDIRKIGADIEAQRLDLEKKYMKGQSLNKLSNNLKKIEPKLAALDRIFINQNRALEFITTLEEVASLNGVSQKINLMTGNSSKEDDYVRTPLQIIAVGEFPAILEYIADLETLNYYINIGSLEMMRTARGQGDAGAKTVTLQLMADTYWK